MSGLVCVKEIINNGLRAEQEAAKVLQETAGSLIERGELMDDAVEKIIKLEKDQAASTRKFCAALLDAMLDGVPE